jgi:hypothetical protein
MNDRFLIGYLRGLAVTFRAIQGLCPPLYAPASSAGCFRKLLSVWYVIGRYDATTELWPFLLRFTDVL